MKRKLLIITAICLALLTCLAFSFAVSAEETKPTVSIEKFNLAFENNTYLKYAVKFDGIDDEKITNSNIGMLYWTDADDGFVPGTEDDSSATTGYTTIGDQKYYVFEYTKLAAKQLTDYIYSVAYLEYEGETYYSAPVKYSALEYAYYMLGKTGEGTKNAELKTLLTDMLAYGASAQQYFNYKEDRLATAEYYQINLVGGTFEDGFSSGLFLSTDEVKIIASLMNSEDEAVIWENSAGEQVFTTNVATIKNITKNETYTAKFAEYTGYVLNPYANVDWSSAQQIKSMTHYHINKQNGFETAVADGYQHFAITNYQPSVPTYPLEDFFTNIPDNVIGSPNSEKVYTVEYGGNIHFNALGSFAEGHGHTFRNKVPWKTAFDEIFDQLQYPDGGGITLNHPVYPSNDPESIYSFMEMLDYDERVLGIEIYNSGSLRHLSSWDTILSTGRRCWGFAVIDWYDASEERKTYGSNILLVPAFTEEDCLKAYRNGEFYAQLKDTGLRFTELNCENGVVSVSVNRETIINFISTNGEIVKSVIGTEASYAVSENDVYVRVEAMDIDDQTSRIFSNPFMFKTREEVAASNDGTLDFKLSETAWNVTGSNINNGTSINTVWEKDGVFTDVEPADLTGYTKYTIEWYNYGKGAASEDGSAYIIERQLIIKSIVKDDSTDEATITWNGKTYAAGDIVYREGNNYWLGLIAFRAASNISSVFAPAPGISPIAKNGEIASFEAAIKVDLGDYHHNGSWYQLSNLIDIAIRQGSTNKVVTSLTVDGGPSNYVDVKCISTGKYYQTGTEARGHVGQEFVLRLELFKSENEGKYIVYTYVNGILIDTCEVDEFEVSNIKIEGIPALARDLVVTLSNVKVLKYVENYDKHVHTFESEWTTDATYHWHAPTCNDDNHCLPEYLSADKGEHVDGNADGVCDVCAKALAGTIKVENPYGLTNTIPTELIEAGTSVTFTVSVVGNYNVVVNGATQVGEPSIDGTTKTFTFAIESVDFGTTIKIDRVKLGVTNKVDYSTLTQSAEDYKTTYVKVSGDTVTASTESDYDYVIVWQYNTLSETSADGSSFTFGRKVVITSLKAFGSDEETSFTAGGVEYKVGTVFSANTVAGSTFNGTVVQPLMSCPNTLTAPADDPTLRLVFDTDIVMAGGSHSAWQQIKILYINGDKCTSTDAHDMLMRYGSRVYIQFGSTKYKVASVGEKFNIRVEIRDVDPTHPDADTNGDGTVDNIPLEFKLYVNGVLTATRIDYVDASSGKYDTIPNQIKLGTLSASRDVFVTFTDTYLDLYK